MLGSSSFGSDSLGANRGTYVTDHYDDLSIFLPLEIRNPDESKYFQLHIKAFIENQNSNNDYALLALHKLFMYIVYGLLYSCMRRDKTISERVFVMAPVRPEQRKQLQGVSSLFTLSLLKERSIFQLMEIFGCEIAKDMDKLKTLVDGRNDLAHCNGQICLNFEDDVRQYLNGLEVLHLKFAPVITKHLRDINDIDFVVPKDAQLDQLKTIISNNGISQRMAELATPSVGKDGLTKKSSRLLMGYLTNEI